VDMKSRGVDSSSTTAVDPARANSARLFFRDVRVPAENVLGQVGDGWNVALGYADARARHARRGMQVAFQAAVRPAGGTLAYHSNAMATRLPEIL